MKNRTGKFRFISYTVVLLLGILMAALLIVLGREFRRDLEWGRRMAPLYQVATLLESQDYEDAGTQLLMIEPTHGGYYEYWMLLGDLETYLENFEKAVPAYETALSLLADENQKDAAIAVDRRLLELRLESVREGESWEGHFPEPRAE